MVRRRPPVTALGASPDELETRFYEALRSGDIESLMSVWSDDDEIVCVHPGGARMIGPAAIRAGFEAIFANGGIPVQVDQVHRLEAVAGVVHHLLERIDVASDDERQTAWIIATNVYMQTAQGWRLVAHHASPGNLHAPELDTVPGRLH